jgi:D-aminopeptidase
MQTIRPRAREWGLAIGSLPTGPHNAITDVGGVLVGHSTVWHGDGASAARAGVTAILPHGGDLMHDRVAAASVVLNGCGELTGSAWVNESGLLEVPILLTDTLSVGRVHDAAITWCLDRYPQLGIEDDVVTPVVGECDNSFLNDARGRHVRQEHVLQALNGASGGAVAEGSVGAGTGMTSYEFKGGIGTASRVSESGYTVGVLLNANHGRRHELLMRGVRIGDHIQNRQLERFNDGSIIIVVATDAPLDSRQLGRLARRSFLGLARTGAISHSASGDFCMAFSTSNRTLWPVEGQKPQLREAIALVHDRAIDPLFAAVEEATEEAAINVLFASDTVVGRSGNTAHGLPLDEIRKLF